MQEWEGRLNVGMSNSVTTAIRESVRGMAIGKTKTTEKADRATVEQVTSNLNCLNFCSNEKFSVIFIVIISSCAFHILKKKEFTIGCLYLVGHVQGIIQIKHINNCVIFQAIDPRTRMVLFKMLNRGVFHDINGCISTGKEVRGSLHPSICYLL